MKLFFRKYGSGAPMVILHGLFGQSDNWNTLAKKFGENGFTVYTVDQRNHGLSPHSDEWNYDVMAKDILELISAEGLNHVILIGHSMGGKTAMQTALTAPEKIGKLIVVDIAPKKYAPHHDKVLEALLSVDFSRVKTRKEVEEKLKSYINDEGTRQFLLKNIYWKTENELAWRFNLKAIAENYDRIADTFNPAGNVFGGSTLFLRGEKSKYIMEEDNDAIKKLFPKADIITIPGSGHWIHADKPVEFYNAVKQFLVPGS
jgi:esterase